ncbi:hypothetical protein [Prauserella cavernicola]|uniref:Uncharacterized protein n=1 Tax=Prauserella cavernicola TaxID=2800127 RepID=A0A934V245_9PSEU|nr:hypothetical protein [Prauserella cavernicola]MBK1784736.1 hypothetical protein [Prauserella cavernicola]
MEHDTNDYLSFVRGFLAASEAEPADGAETTEPPETGGALNGWNPESYAEGYAAAGTVEFPVTYRELSVQDDGRFTGTLDFGDLDVPHDPEPYLEPYAEQDDDLPHVSGTLDLQ